MSRIGRKSIILPKGVKIVEQERLVQVTGAKGSLSMTLSPHVVLRQENGQVLLDRTSEDREARAHHGLMRNLLANMVTGVTTGFERRLDIQGVGFKAEVAGSRLNMSLGYSHPVIYDIPQGIEIAVERQTKLIVKGMDAQKVGQVAAEIRAFREPDIYKGKGVRYENESIKLKPGKTGSK